MNMEIILRGWKGVCWDLGVLEHARPGFLEHHVLKRWAGWVGNSPWASALARSGSPAAGAGTETRRGRLLLQGGAWGAPWQ